MFGVSERTVRDHVRRANDALAETARIVWSRSRAGYVIECSDRSALERLLSRGRAVAVTSPSNRASYLLNDLLQRNDWITIDDLAAMLYVSRASISADLKAVEHDLARYGLSLEKRPRYGIRIAGSEMARRLCLAEGAVRRAACEDGGFDAPVRRSTACAPAAFELELESTLRSVSSCVEKVLASEDFAINSFSRQNLLVHIAIALLRMESAHIVPFDTDQAQALSGTRELEVARLIADALDAELGCELPDEEVGYIAIHLAGKRVMAESDAAPPAVGLAGSENSSLVISDEVWDVVGCMLDAVWRGFRFDFRDDVELRMNLARHVAPLSVRLRYRLSMENPMLGNIRARYPLAYAMAVDAGSVLAASYGSVPSDAEAGYIALAFALALERKKTERPKKNVLVVCASGMGTARLLAYKIQQEFGSCLGEVSICNASQVASADYSRIDYVFTTVSLEEAVPVPVREITLLFDDDDRHAVSELLSEDAAADDLAMFFPRDLFFPHCLFTSREEGITFLATAMQRHQPELPGDFERLIFDREGIAPTAFGNGVALPHPIEAVGEHTATAVALLDEPLAWAGHEVQAVFLTSIAREAEPSLQAFYSAAARLFNSASAIEALVRVQDYDVLISMLRNK